MTVARQHRHLTKSEVAAWHAFSFFTLTPDQMELYPGTASLFQFTKPGTSFENFIYGMVVHAWEQVSGLESALGEELQDVRELLNRILQHQHVDFFRRNAIETDADWREARLAATKILEKCGLPPTLPNRPFVVDRLIDDLWTWNTARTRN